ncbi:MAG: hypothetical protein EOO07_35295 [Chitinophagaceae bacterium]|nr:MAG: hypothetical protein EOO07_35295 [Chitinophagaceae bacterium]
MEDKKETTQSVIDQLKEYVETRITLAKYKAIEQGTSVVAGLAVSLVLVVLALFTLSFASLTLAWYLSDILASTWKGFGIVGGIYLLLVLIILIAKSSIEKSIINGFIKKIFK